MNKNMKEKRADMKSSQTASAAKTPVYTLEKGFGLTRNEGKVAIVTGAGQWIGRATALRLALEGCDVVVDDIVITRAQEVAEEIRALGRRAVATGCDVTKNHEVKKMVADTIEEFGHLDIIVNNVGGGPVTFPNDFINSDEETWDYVLGKNLYACMYTTRAAINHMAERGSGHIVNLSSGAGLRGCPGEADYCAAKAGIHGFTTGLSYEVVNLGIRINTVVVAPCGDAPSKVRKNMTPEELLARDVKRSGYPRWGKPEEIAALVAFLCSDESDFINGQVYSVGGPTE